MTEKSPEKHTLVGLGGKNQGSRGASMVLINVVRFSLTAVALWDLRRRSAEQINGQKRLWNLIVLINFVGPIAYFVFGRKRSA